MECRNVCLTRRSLRKIRNMGGFLRFRWTEKYSALKFVEIATQTKQNAVNVNQANELALSAKENAAQGNQQMKEMLSSMVEINASSAYISKIKARSANAAKETTALIEGSIYNVEACTKIANETAGALNKIVMTVEKAADLVGEIAGAMASHADVAVSGSEPLPSARRNSVSIKVQ